MKRGKNTWEPHTVLLSNGRYLSKPMCMCPTDQKEALRMTAKDLSSGMGSNHCTRGRKKKETVLEEEQGGVHVRVWREKEEGKML